MRLQSFFALLAVALPLVQCAPISHNEIVANSAKGLRLLELEEGADPVWVTEEEKDALIIEDKGFFDVTETYEAWQNLPATDVANNLFASYPNPSHQTQVKAIINTLSIDNLKTNLNTLTQFNNRRYDQSTGADASKWIFDKVKSIAGSRSDITVSQFTHSFQQPSVILKIAGTSASSPATIFGAHLDSTNQASRTGRAPGADDDGSGTVTLIETVRALVASGFKPSTPLEFHWYAGEEGGLLGSQAVSTNYKNAGVSVKAMIQFDMVAYFKPGTKEVISLNNDYSDSGLNSWLVKVASAYSAIPAELTRTCGYGCSDHASWYKAGYPTAFPFEAADGEYNPYIHSASDTTTATGFSWTHALEFVKLAVGAAYELTV
ncbi:hypothetical protein V5O48_005212 [Marasmius crinis-equi]|uniref:Peptide hydrolase n=1 Tax=Marasmius crinis-equi TaxID=585013 RepID=A0ABR3FMY6_9AGAR